MHERELIQRIAFNVAQGRIEAEDEGFDEGLDGQPAVTEVLSEALERGLDPKLIVLEGLSKGMEVVGEKFAREEYFIPDMLAAAECVGAAMDVLNPHLIKAGVESNGKFVIATVAGDLHDIGKNIVSIMLKGAGYEVIDLGADVPTERIVSTVSQYQAPFLGLSALLTTTMKAMGKVIEELQKARLRKDIKVLIGGAPVSEGFAKQIGADAYCKDAFQAIKILKNMRSGL